LPHFELESDIRFGGFLFKSEKIFNLRRIIKSDLKEKADMCPSGEKSNQMHFLFPHMASKTTQQCEKSRICFMMFKGAR